MFRFTVDLTLGNGFLAGTTSDADTVDNLEGANKSDERMSEDRRGGSFT